MRLAALALALVVAAAGSASAQPRALDPDDVASYLGTEPPQVILLTFGVGDVIFEKFGHAALCLDYRTQEPICFNYGVTDFAGGVSMVWSFLRSSQRFWVEPGTWSEMIDFYQWEDRDIWEQVLPLTPTQARAAEQDILATLPEAKRYYTYDHFADNCTTKLRDIIDRASGGALRVGSGVAYALTYREIGHRGLADLPPLIALTDFVLGRQLDDTPTLWQAMFHPDVLRQHVTFALGVPPRLLYKRHGPPFPTSGSSWRLQMLAIGLAFGLPLLVATWRRRYERVALVWATLFIAGWGIALWGLAIVSSISGLRWNENMLVFVPLDGALPFLSAERRRRYAQFRVAGLMFVSALCALGVLHQPLWIPLLSALLPLATIAFDQKIAPLPS